MKKKKNSDTINLMGKEIKIEKSFDKVFCNISTGTRASQTFSPYKDIDIKFNDVFYNFKVLESGSVIFTKEKNSDKYYVTAFGSMFSALKEQDSVVSKKTKRVEEIEKEINILLEERNEILKSLGKCDSRPITF